MGLHPPLVHHCGCTVSIWIFVSSTSTMSISMSSLSETRLTDLFWRLTKIGSSWRLTRLLLLLLARRWKAVFEYYQTVLIYRLRELCRVLKYPVMRWLSNIRRLDFYSGHQRFSDIPSILPRTTSKTSCNIRYVLASRSSEPPNF